MPDPPVDIRLSIHAGLRASYGYLTQIAAFVKDRIPTAPLVISTLARTTLLSAARVVVLLGPDGPEERHANGLKVMRQEATSLGRLYTDAER